MTRDYKKSQNFLRSPQIAMVLVGHTNIKKNDFTLDIGAGSGVFTYALSKKSAQVLAIENDKSAVQKLRNNTKDLANVKIFAGDFFSFDLSKLPSDYKICSNIPFHLSSPILKRLANTKNQPAAIYLILQKQFARKLMANDRHFTSILGAQIYPFYDIKIKKPLQKTDFTPPPAVDTVFLEMKRREQPLVKHKINYEKMIEDLFTDNEKFKRAVDNTKFTDLKPSQLTGREWLEIFGKRCSKADKWKNQSLKL